MDKKIPSAIPSVRQVQFKENIPMVGEYYEIIDYQTQMESRNNVIADIVVTESKKNRKVLVLTKRVKHYESIKEHLDRSLDRGALGGVRTLKSTTKKAERDKEMLELRGGESDFSIILGTYSLLSTGIDIPSLDCLVLAGDIKSDVLLEQSGGRVRRIFQGKKDPLIIDIQDTGNPILRHQSKARNKAYKELKWKVL